MLAGVQAGVVSLVFILIVILMSVRLPTIVGTIIIACLTVLASFVFDKENPILIAVMIIIGGLICAGIFVLGGLATLGVSLVAGLILGSSWAIAVNHTVPQQGELFS